MLMVCQGVGFSYCTSKLCVNTDESMATDMYTFLVNFFTAYPEYKSNDFYITGESCAAYECSVPSLTPPAADAGIYIPLIMEQIMNNGGGINLKGAGEWFTTLCTQVSLTDHT